MDGCLNNVSCINTFLGGATGPSPIVLRLSFDRPFAMLGSTERKIYYCIMFFVDS